MMTVTGKQDQNLRDAAEELFGYSPCMHCRNFIPDINADNHCKAFPDRIPDEIFFGKNLHKEPYHGDHGIQFIDDES